MNELKPYVVMLHEDIDDKFQIRFECQAEDPDHACEQAENAYPNCQITHFYLDLENIIK